MWPHQLCLPVLTFPKTPQLPLKMATLVSNNILITVMSATTAGVLSKCRQWLIDEECIASQLPDSIIGSCGWDWATCWGIRSVGRCVVVTVDGCGTRKVVILYKCVHINSSWYWCMCGSHRSMKENIALICCWELSFGWYSIWSSFSMSQFSEPFCTSVLRGMAQIDI